jgi:catechol 2,3-dioxygenase-like lactoylglutathione lyase family enzyme
MHIDHINIKAPLELLREVRDFYCHVLGLAEGFRPNFDSNGFWLYSGDKAIIHLSESPESPGHGAQGFFDHFAIHTEDLTPIIERLDTIAHKYKMFQISEIGLSQLFFKDLTGTGVEVNCRDKLT